MKPDKRKAQQTAKTLTEQFRRADCYPILVEALERVEQTASHSVDCTSRHPFGECDCFKSAVANALTLAKGE